MFVLRQNAMGAQLRDSQYISSAHMKSEDHIVPPQPAEGVESLARRWTRPERVAQIMVLATGVGFVIVAVVVGRTVSTLSLVGYPGVMFLSFLGSAALVLPVPGLISLCGVSVLLNPLVLGILAGASETLGEISGYAIGYGGRGIVEKRRFYQKVQVLMSRHGALVLFLVSIVPNPLFDLVGIAAGGTRYPLAKFLGVVLVGKTFKGVMVGYSCYYGIRLLPWIE